MVYTVRLQGTADWHRTEDWRQLMGNYRLNDSTGIWESTHQFESDGEMHRSYISRSNGDRVSEKEKSERSTKEEGRWFVWFPSMEFVGDTGWAYYRTSAPCDNLWDARGSGAAGTVIWERNDGEGLDGESGDPNVKWVPDPKLEVVVTERPATTDETVRHTVASKASEAASSGAGSEVAETAAARPAKNNKSMAERVFGQHDTPERSEMECHVAMSSAVRTHARLLRESAADRLPMDPVDLHAMHHHALHGAVRQYLETTPSFPPSEVTAVDELLKSAERHYSDLAATNLTRAAAASKLAADELLVATAPDESIRAEAALAVGAESAGNYVAERMERVSAQYAKVAQRPTASNAPLTQLLANVAKTALTAMFAGQDGALVAATSATKEAEVRADEAEAKWSALLATLDAQGTSDGDVSKMSSRAASVAELTRQLAESERSALNSNEELAHVKAELQEVNDHLEDEIAHRKELDQLQKQMRMQQKAAKSSAQQSWIPRMNKTSSPRSSVEGSSTADEASKLHTELKQEQRSHFETRGKLEDCTRNLRLLEDEMTTLEADYRERLKAQHRRMPRKGIPGVDDGSRIVEGGISPDVLEAAMAKAKATADAAAIESAEAHKAALAHEAAAKTVLDARIQQLEDQLGKKATELATERADKERLREREATLLDHLDQMSQEKKQRDNQTVDKLTGEVERLTAALSAAESTLAEQSESAASLEEERASMKVREQQLEEWLSKAEKEYKSRHDDIARKEEEEVDANKRYRKKLSETKSSVKNLMQAVEESHHNDKAHLATLLATAHSTNASEHGTFVSHLDTLALDVDAMNESVRQLEASFVASDAADIKHSKTVGSFLTIQALTKRTQKQHLAVRALESAVQEEKESKEDISRRLVEQKSVLERQVQDSQSELKQLYPVLETTQHDLEKLRTVAEDRKIKVGKLQYKIP
jgi:hypothetical protein